MKHFKPVLYTSAAALIASAGMAFADVTAEEVWANWKDGMISMGKASVTGTESKSGGTLTVSDAAMTVEAPDAKVVVTLGTIELKERGDGTVAINLPPNMPITVNATPPGEDPVTVSMTLNDTGMTIVASGDSGRIAYDYLASEIAVSLDGIEGAKNAGDMKVSISLKDIAGKSSATTGDLREMQSSMTAGSMSIDVAATNPETQGKFDLMANMADLKAESSGKMPAGADEADLNAMLAAGLDMAGSLAYAASNYSMNFDESGNTMSAQATASGGGVTYAMGPAGLNYTTTSKGLSLTMTSSQIPFPVTVTMEDSAFGMAMPIAKSDAPQDLGMLIKLVNFAVNDEIWQMLDPTGALPHDPATVIVDVKGKANWTVDITDPTVAQNLEGMPGQLHEVNLDQLQVTAAGADLTGTGAFTFDNTNTEAFGGMPAPEGKVDLKIVGANALIDKLGAMGLLPDDQAMTAHMMLGMFARPGDGQDTMVSTIEVKKDGSVLANGMQLK
jgi:hypothetical protein